MLARSKKVVKPSFVRSSLRLAVFTWERANIQRPSTPSGSAPEPRQDKNKIIQKPTLQSSTTLLSRGSRVTGWPRWADHASLHGSLGGLLVLGIGTIQPWGTVIAGFALFACFARGAVRSGWAGVGGVAFWNDFRWCDLMISKKSIDFRRFQTRPKSWFGILFGLNRFFEILYFESSE